MSLELFDFSSRGKRRIFWWVIGLSLFYAILSASWLITNHLKEKAVKLEMDLANESALFIAPRGILNPQGHFDDLAAYEDSLPHEEPELPDSVAPEGILDPAWSVRFVKPTQENI